MKIGIGSDHVGYCLKEYISGFVRAKGHEIIDYGTDSEERTDYPVFGEKVGKAVSSGECELGILICGTGVGISIAANKVKGIRAAVCSEPYSARLSRQHNNANIIAFGARVIGRGLAELIVDEFLCAAYQNGRHEKRVAMISKIESGEN